MVSKKGQIAIGLLVLMTLVLVGTALFSFYTNSQNLKLQIVDARFVDKVYTDEIVWKEKMQKQAETSIIDQYSKVDIQGKSSKEIENEIENSVGKILISDDKNVSDVKEASITFNDENVDISMEDFPISGGLILKNKERVWVWGFIPAGSFEQIKSSVGVIYRPSMVTSLNLTKIGLQGFGQIDSALEYCKTFNTNQGIENCLGNRLVNFDFVANITTDDNGTIHKSVEMRSKKTFSVYGELIKIEFKTMLT